MESNAMASRRPALLAQARVAMAAIVAAAGPLAPATAQESAQLDSDIVAALLQRIEVLEAQVAALQATAASGAPQAAAPVPVEPPEPVASAVAAAGPEAAPVEVDPDEQDRLITAAFQRTLIERGGLLLPPGVVDFDPGLRYMNSSSERIVIDGFTILPVLIIGDIVSERVRRELTELSGTARFGLPRGLQLDVRLPMAYQKQRVVTAESTQETTSDFDVGDLELGVSRQLRRSTGAGPDLLGSLRWKTTTGSDPFEARDDELVLGSGYRSLNVALNAVKVVDPAVFFGGLNYTYNASSHVSFGKFEPGNSYGFDLGMAIALNLSTSLSFAYDHQFARRSVVNHIGIPGSDTSTGVFSVGASYSLNDSRNFNFALGVGVTEDSPDVLIDFSLPLRFRY